MPLDNIQIAQPGIRFPTVIGVNSTDDNPDFPVVNDVQVKGGLKAFDSIAKRNSYKAAGRQWGMIAYVTNDPENPGYNASFPTPAWFYLENRATNDLANNANWVQITFGASKVYRAVIGDGVNTDFAITHGCNDITPTVSAYHIRPPVSGDATATPNVIVTGANSIILQFTTVIQSDAVRVKIVGD
jgi:hypothetical protein